MDMESCTYRVRKFNVCCVLGCVMEFIITHICFLFYARTESARDVGKEVRACVVSHKRAVLCFAAAWNTFRCVLASVPFGRTGQK